MMKALTQKNQRLVALFAITVVFWGLWIAAFGPWLRAQSASSWLDANPVLGQRQEIPPGGLPESIAFAGNIPCSTTTFRLKPAIPLVQSAETAQACAVMTPQGLTAPGGFTSVFKSDARLFNSGGGPVSFYPIPGDSSGVVLEHTSQGHRLHYYSSGVLSSRPEFNNLTREMKVYLASAPSWTLKDKADKTLHVRPDSLSFSSNGRWLVVDSPSVAMLLVNLSTAEVVPFSTPYNYNSGLAVAPHTAVSDDGKTTVTASNSGDLKLVDLASCAPVPDLITGPVACGVKRHETYLASRIPGYHRTFQPRFLNDRRLSLYVSYNTSPTIKALAKFRLAPAGDTLENQDYLALGDSFASGEGAYDYFPETDTDENMCHLSKRSYPYLVGQQLSLGTFNSVACSGAKIQDITTYVQKQILPPFNNLGRLLPGYKKQIQYVYDQNPNVVTVGIGGNDIGFGDILKRCVGSLTPTTCYESYEDRLELVRLVNSQFDKLAGAFNQIRAAARNDSKVYAVGYPRLAKENGDCALNVKLNNQEIIFSNQVIDYLNKIIELSASKAGIRYVDVTDAFAGHKMCENHTSLVAMNGLTSGDNKFRIIGNESYHPNSLGHQLYKSFVLSQTSNLNQAMPLPNPSVQLPSEDSGLAILDAPRSNRPVNQISHDEKIASSLLVKGDTMVVQVRSDDHFLQPNSDYRGELRSDPLQLGTFTTDSSGNIFAEVPVPDELEPGFHSLHILGKNVANQSVDIYKTVYLAESHSDYDGDGVPNQTDESQAAVERFKSSDDDFARLSSGDDSQPQTLAAQSSRRFRATAATRPAGVAGAAGVAGLVDLAKATAWWPALPTLALVIIVLIYLNNRRHG